MTSGAGKIRTFAWGEGPAWGAELPVALRVDQSWWNTGVSPPVTGA